MTRSTRTKDVSGGEQPTGEPTRQAIGLMPRLGDRIVAEFRAEPCPEGQAELRAAVTHAFTAALSIAVRDAGDVFDALPPAAQATFDENVANFHLVESAQAALDLDGPGVKDIVIFILELLLKLLPQGRIKIILEFLLALLRKLQELAGGKNGGSTLLV